MTPVLVVGAGPVVRPDGHVAAGGVDLARAPHRAKGFTAA